MRNAVVDTLITKSFKRLLDKGIHRGFITYHELAKSFGKRQYCKENIEKAFLALKEKRTSITLETVNRFLSDEIYSKLKIDGIIYDDKPMNRKDRTRIYSNIPDLYYKKRIQMVCFDLKIINTFALYLDEQS